jgi:hypothetical protein
MIALCSENHTKYIEKGWLLNVEAGGIFFKGLREVNRDDSVNTAHNRYVRDHSIVSS